MNLLTKKLANLYTINYHRDNSALEPANSTPHSRRQSASSDDSDSEYKRDKHASASSINSVVERLARRWRAALAMRHQRSDNRPLAVVQQAENTIEPAAADSSLPADEPSSVCVVHVHIHMPHYIHMSVSKSARDLRTCSPPSPDDSSSGGDDDEDVSSSVVWRRRASFTPAQSV